MDIFTRVSDIISANLNEMIEKFEDPEKMLKQAIREMGASIEEARTSAAQAMADEKILGKELEKNRREAALWADRAASAVADDNDDLARKALVRKQEHEKITAALEEQLDAAHQLSTTLRRQLEAMDAKLADAKRRLDGLAVRRRAAALSAKMDTSNVEPILQSDAFTKFDRLREKVELAEAEAEAMRDLTSRGEAGQLPDEPRRDTSDDIEAELARLKRRRSAR